MQVTLDLGLDPINSIVSSTKVKRKPRKPESNLSCISQPIISFGNDQEESGEFGPWILTKKTDNDLVQLADRHYSRVTPGASQFTRPGHNLVMRTQNGDAGFVSWYSQKRDDGFKDVIENTFFRNESRFLSSDLVKWAIYATTKVWGIPSEGFITFVKDKAIRSGNPGSNYLHAGFKKVGKTKSRNLTILQLFPEDVEATIQEIRLIHSLQYCKSQIELAMEDGDFTEAVSFFQMAMEYECRLRSMKSDRARRKGKKWDTFEPNEDPFDFLHAICPDGWIPEEMAEILENESSIYSQGFNTTSCIGSETIMNQKINEYLLLNALEQTERGCRYQVVATVNGVVEHTFFVAKGDETPPLEIANRLATEDWLQIENDNELECSFNFQYDDLGKYFIVESKGLTNETRSFDEAQSWYSELKAAAKACL
ncbi:hypothetical protein [Paenibacillus sp. Y412MC10]|uniref:hypothetical protein n=1 Tax=Geobacillus sp. (strain Y412MC10) TaxID=481743 RepID=UPI0011AB473A|nr:hypothetical protein [Paenibacillus sp. Y412MC10]